MLSICVTIKNRSLIPTEHGTLTLFQDCIKSLNKCLPLSEPVELIISDWKSNDFPIRDWVENQVDNIPIHLITIDAPGFSKGKGLNLAVEHSTGNNLFFCDADMILNTKTLNYGIEIAKNGGAYYPTIKYQTEYNSDKVMNHEGGGLFFIRKDLFYKAGTWPEYWEYGFEDTEMVKRVKTVTEIVTKNDAALFHQWHPQSYAFKNKYGIKKVTDQERTKTRCENEVKRTELETRIMVRALINDPNVQHPRRNNDTHKR